MLVQISMVRVAVHSLNHIPEKIFVNIKKILPYLESVEEILEKIPPGNCLSLSGGP